MRHSERTGLLFALAGFAMLSVGDAVVKSMAGLWPGTAIAALRYLFGAIGLGAVLLVRDGPGACAVTDVRWHALRGLGAGVSAAAFFFALKLMPLAEATAISFTSPMLTALLAAAILGEPMRRQTWVASLVAFGGVLVVLRPSFAAIGVAALLPLVSATCMGLLMIGNRAVAGRGSLLATQFRLALFALAVLLVLAFGGRASGWPPLDFGLPAWSVVARCAFVAISASCAHALIYLGTTRAGAATIAPMTYIQLLMAGLFGWLFFAEMPDATALAGAAVIVAAGLYLWGAGRVSDPPPGTD